MPITLTESHSFILFFKAEGKITTEDFSNISPIVDETLQKYNNNLRIIFDVRESDLSLKDIAMDVMWDEIKRSFTENTNFDRLAIVGLHKWEEKLVHFLNWDKYFVEVLSPIINTLFFSCTLEYFHTHKQDEIPIEAIQWIHSGTGLPYPLKSNEVKNDIKVNSDHALNKDNNENINNNINGEELEKNEPKEGNNPIDEVEIKNIIENAIPKEPIHWLVAIDEHEESQIALKVAIKMIKNAQNDGKHSPVLHLLAVYCTNDYYMDYMLGEDIVGDIMRKAAEVASKELNSVDVHSILVPYNSKYPGAAIVDFAQKLPASFLVVGSRGRGTLKKFLLGSASQFVVEHSPCPVILCNLHTKI